MFLERLYHVVIIIAVLTCELNHSVINFYCPGRVDLRKILVKEIFKYFPFFLVQISILVGMVDLHRNNVNVFHALSFLLSPASQY